MTLPYSKSTAGAGRKKQIRDMLRDAAARRFVNRHRQEPLDRARVRTGSAGNCCRRHCRDFERRGGGMIGATFCSGIGAAEVAAPWVDWRLASEIAKET